MSTITKLEAGPELDLLILTEVLGWEEDWKDRQGHGFITLRYVSPEGLEFHSDEVPRFSQEIATAWELVERLGGMVLIPVEGWEEKAARQASGWYAQVTPGSMYMDYLARDPSGDGDYGPAGLGYFAPSVELAICGAALHHKGYFK